MQICAITSMIKWKWKYGSFWFYGA